MSNDRHVAILLPTKGRAEQAEARIVDVLSQKRPPGVTLTVIAAVEEEDKETITALDRLREKYDFDELYVVQRPPDTTAVQGWNAAYHKAREMGVGWVVLGADDVEWKDGWLKAALNAAAGRAQVVGLNDGHTNMPHYGAHYMASVAFLEERIGGYMAPPKYGSWWFDREVCERANALGLYAYTPEPVIEHHHPDWGLAEMDATYEEAWPLHDVDREVYLKRRAQGYPLDYPEAKMQTSPENKMQPAAVEAAAPAVDATDAALRILEEAGIDPATVKGSGVGGRILVADAEAAVEAQSK